MTETTPYAKVFFRKKGGGSPMARLLIEDWPGAWCVKPIHQAAMECLPKVAYEQIYWVEAHQCWQVKHGR